MNIFVFANIVKPRYITKAKEIIFKLNQLEDFHCYLSKEEALMMYNDEKYAAKAAKDCDIIVSIGGDGTVLRAAQASLQYDLPLAGINVGRLGALCCLNEQDLVGDPFKNLKISKRSMLEINYDNNKYYALNDIVIAHHSCGYAIETKMKVSGNVFEYRGDGIIISTPTGSSAYNCAAGGPVIDPSAPSNVITPICPCGLFKECYIVSNKEDIFVKMKREDELADIFVDGLCIGEMKKEVVIKTASKQISLLRK